MIEARCRDGYQVAATPAGAEGDSRVVEDHEVEARGVSASRLGGRTALGLELIDEIDGGEEATARSSSDAASRDGDGQMRLAGAGSGQDDIALLGGGSAAGQIAHRGLLIGVSLKVKSSTSLASSSLATVSWYLIRRAASLRSRPRESADQALRLIALMAGQPHAFSVIERSSRKLEPVIMSRTSVRSMGQALLS